MKARVVDRCKVWEINDKERYAEVKFSCSRKVKDYDKDLVDNNIAKNGYISSYHSFVRFVGHAYNKLKSINIGDTITNLDIEDSTTEPYWDSKNNCVAYPKHERLTVFDFEVYNPDTQTQNSSRNLDKAPQVADSTSADNNVNIVNEVTQEPTPVAEDVCPF